MNVTFVGLGRMGSGMARNLLNAGHSVTLYNRTRNKAEAVAAEAAGGRVRVADSISDSLRGSEVVMSMLADDHALEEITFTAEGILAILLRVRFMRHAAPSAPHSRAASQRSTPPGSSYS